MLSTSRFQWRGFAASLLALGLTLSAVLIWQAYASFRAQQQVLRVAMENYAVLAGHRMVQAGLYTLFRKLSRLNTFVLVGSQSPTKIVTDLEKALQGRSADLAEVQPLVKAIFIYRSDRRQSWWSTETIGDDAFESWIGRGPGQVGLFVGGENGDRVFYANPLPENSDWQGFVGVEVDVAAMTSELWSALESPLLPGLMGRDFDNTAFRFEFRNPNGQVLAVSRDAPDIDFAVTLPMTSIYADLLPGYELTISMDPAKARALLSDQPEPTQAWQLLLSAVGLLIVMILSFMLFKRERQLLAAREDFIAQVSHELRTPLTQIRLYAETLRLNRLRNDTKRDHALTVIDREARRLGELVDNVLNFSRLRKNGLIIQPQNVDLVIAVREIANQFAEMHNEMQINLSATATVNLQLDPYVLRQILFNLLDNSVKYGGGHVCVEIIICASPQPSLRISDNGPGIPHEERDKVWQEFYRVCRDNEKAASGAGIGLALVRTLVERSGGEIRLLDSQSGASFEICFYGAVE